MNKQSISRDRAEAGFTLIEVLLTMVILSIGLLGLGAMQVVGLKSNNTASYRSIATLVAADMTERIRANPEGVAQGLFRAVSKGTHPATDCSNLPTNYCSTHLNGGTLVPGSDCDPKAPATATAMADYDINVVYCGTPMDEDTPAARAATGLKMLPGGGDMRITSDCPPNAGVYNCTGLEHVVTVSWKEPVRNADGTTGTVSRSLVVPFTP